MITWKGFFWLCLTWLSTLRALPELLRPEIWINCVAENIKDVGGSNTDLYGEKSPSTKIHLLAFRVHSQKVCICTECDWIFVLIFFSPCTVPKDQEWTFVLQYWHFFHQLFPLDWTAEKTLCDGEAGRENEDEGRAKTKGEILSYVWLYNSFTHKIYEKGVYCLFCSVYNVKGFSFWQTSSFSVAKIKFVFLF